MKDQEKTKSQLIDELVELRKEISNLNEAETVHNGTEAKHPESEPLLGLLVESAPGAFVVSKADGQIVLVNSNTEKLFGYQPEELLGKPVETLMPERFRKAHVDHRTGFFSHPEMRPMGRNLELYGQHKDGSEFPIDVYLSPITLGDESFVLSASFDITERKQAEEAMQASEARFRMIYEYAPVMIDAFDDNGRCILWNSQCQKVFGWTMEEINAHDNPLALFYPDPEIQKQVLDTISSKPEKVFREWHPLAKDGSELVTLWANFNLPDKIVINLGYDITERRQAEDSLRWKHKSQQLLQMVAVAANEATDVQTALKSVLKQVCAYAGWPIGHVYLPANDSSGQLRPTTIWELQEPERFESFKRVTEKTSFDPGVGLPGRVFSTGKPAWIFDVTKDTNFPRAKLATDIGVKAGFGFPVLVGTEVVAVLEFFSSQAVEPDEALLEIMANVGTQLGRVFERKQAEEEIKGLGKFPSENPQPVLRVERDGAILFANKAAVSFLNGRQNTDGWRLPENWLSSVKDALDSGAYLKEELKHGDYTLSILFVPNSDLRCVNVYVNDITGLKQAEEELRGYRDHLEELVAERTVQLEAANKELEAFSYSVSHDLRAPLRAIDGFGGALAEDYGDKLDAEGNRLLGIIRESATQMGQLIDDLLTFSRLGRQEVKASRIDMTALAKGVSEDLKSAAPKEIEIKIGKLPSASGDRSLLHHVFQNLIDNAIKYSRLEKAPVVEIQGRTEKSERIYSVRDNGVGFDMKYADKLFAVFQRLHRADEFEGTGVGLALVQRIVHRHGGRVWAEAEVGQGATFHFTLPTKEAQ